MGSLRARTASFRHAARGLGVLVRQPNAVIHLCVAVLVIGVAAYLPVRAGDWIILIFAIALGLSAEAMNTALERLVDLASPEWNALARDAKDVAAAAVLICAVGAACVGVLVFWPYVFGTGTG